MSPLLLQITIGAGGLLAGFTIGTLLAAKRLRNTRRAAVEQADGLENRMAIQRLQIREFEGKLEEASRTAPTPTPDEAPPAREASPIPDAVAQMPSVTPTRPKWLATKAERLPDSAPPRA